MGASLVRKAQTGEPGNGGEFGTIGRNESAVELTNVTAEPSNVFDRVDVEWARRLAEDYDTPAPVLAQLARSSVIELRAAAAGNESTPDEVSVELAGDAEQLVRKSLSWRDNLSAEVVDLLMAEDDYEVWEGLASSENLRSEHQSALSASDYAPVRERLASNVDVLPAILDKLAADEESYVRRGAAGNPELTEESALLLARDENIDVRKQLTYKKRSLTVQRILADDSAPPVRYELVGMPGLDSTVYEQLRNDKNDSVNARAKRPKFY